MKKIFTLRHIIIFVLAWTTFSLSCVTAQTAFMKVVAADGSGDYNSVQEAVNNAPKDGTRMLIFVKNGFYKEQVSVPQGAVVSLIGESRDGTIISHDLSHTMGYDDAAETSTIYVDGFDFYGDNFTTQNTVGPDGGQAECFTVASDRAVLRHVNLKANQDGIRFFTDSRSYLKNCYIEGTVDYIYDSGIAFIDDCTIKQLRGGYIVAPGNCFVTVPRAVSRQLTGQARLWGLGLFIRGCRLIYDADKVGERGSYLGRNWGKTTCAAYFINCYMDKHICPEGWQKMSDTQSIYIGEYGSMDMDGNPIDLSGRVSWAMTEDPEHMSPSQYIDQKVVDNIFNMEYVFNLADEQLGGRLGLFEPQPFVTPTASVTKFTAVDGNLQWDKSEGAAGYIIYKNGRYLTNLTETSYTDADARAGDSYALRTVSVTGCLGDEVTGTPTGITNVRAQDIEIRSTRYGIYWNRKAQATLYSLDGEILISRNGACLEWGEYPQGVYILRLVFVDGTSLTRKIVKNQS